MFVLTNSDYIPVACSNNSSLLYEKALRTISSGEPYWTADNFKYDEDTGDIYIWDSTGWSEYYQETQMGWCLTFWKITKVEEI